MNIADNMKPKLLLAEDHPAMRAKVAALLKRDFDVIATVANGQAAVEAANGLMLDILILDVSMPILNGPEVARRLKLQGCKAKIVFLSVSRDIDQITACLAAGGDAYVFKTRMGTELIHAIAEVLAGRTYVSPEAG
jgi:DNA-binding NarL/FixJ family response regulator